MVKYQSGHITNSSLFGKQIAETTHIFILGN